MSETKNQETRKCEVCGEIKPVADFSKSYRNRCKPCVAEMCRNDRKSHNNPVEEKTSTLKWQTLNLTDALIGMHVLVKGYNRITSKVFFAVGYIDKYSNQFALLREEDKELNYIESVRLFSRSCSYWYINIDEIEE